MPRLRRTLSPLGEALTDLLRDRGMSDADFARLTGLSKGLLSQIKHRPPSKLPKKVDIRRWAKLLRLTQEEQEALQNVAEITYSPLGIQSLLARQLLTKFAHKRE